MDDNIINERAFSSDGYIISQNLTANIRFGLFSSDKNGCGWIALYNFLRANNEEITCYETIASMKKRLMLGGILGTNFFAIASYLKKNGWKIKLGFTKRALLKQDQDLYSGIILYYHKRGGHFICFLREDERYFRFLNLRDGSERCLMSMEAFIKRYGKFPILLSITNNKKGK